MTEKDFNGIKDILLRAIKEMEYNPRVSLSFEQSLGTEQLIRLGEHNSIPVYTGDMSLSVSYSNPVVLQKNTNEFYKYLDRAKK